MKYIPFNNTDLMVSAICLGTSNYGTAFSVESSINQLDRFAELGGNFIDSAHVYGDWIPGEKGRSERVIGTWFEKNNNRSKIILVTKGGHPFLETFNVSRLQPDELDTDLNESLENLKTNYIDLYFLHRDDPSIPVGTIIEYLEQKVREGKIKYYGCSNWSLPRIMEAQQYAKEHGYQGFVCNQIMGCLADVNQEALIPRQMMVLDKEFKKYHKETKMNLMAYMSISRGYFSRRAWGEELPVDMVEMYGNKSNDNILEKLKQICGDQYTMTDFAFKYVMMQDFPSIPIASFENDLQLEDCMKCAELELDKELMASVSQYKELQ